MGVEIIIIRKLLSYLFTWHNTVTVAVLLPSKSKAHLIADNFDTKNKDEETVTNGPIKFPKLVLSQKSLFRDFRVLS